MPELPDLVLYVDQIRARVAGRPLDRVRIVGPNLLRTVSPAPESAEGRSVQGVRRLGKRIVLEFEGGRSTRSIS